MEGEHSKSDYVQPKLVGEFRIEKDLSRKQARQYRSVVVGLHPLWDALNWRGLNMQPKSAEWPAPSTVSAFKGLHTYETKIKTKTRRRFCFSSVFDLLLHVGTALIRGITPFKACRRRPLCFVTERISGTGGTVHELRVRTDGPLPWYTRGGSSVISCCCCCCCC